LAGEQSEEVLSGGKDQMLNRGEGVGRKRIATPAGRPGKTRPA
jgi:hypothetical protein